MVVSGPETITRTEAWLRESLAERPDLHVVITDVTSAYSIINLQGPLSRDLLATLTDADLSTEAFGFATMQTIEVHYARVFAQRMTYTGELGFELFVPSDMAASLFEAIVAAGAEFGLGFVGLATLDSLRMEKANRDYTHDVDNSETPLEVGLKFTCAFDTEFRGRDALAPIADAIPTRRLVQVALDDPQPVAARRRAAPARRQAGRLRADRRLRAHPRAGRRAGDDRGRRAGCQGVDRGGRVHHARVRGPPCGRRTHHREPPPPLRPHRRPLRGTERAARTDASPARAVTFAVVMTANVTTTTSRRARYGPQPGR